MTSYTLLGADVVSVATFAFPSSASPVRALRILYQLLPAGIFLRLKPASLFTITRSRVQCLEILGNSFYWKPEIIGIGIPYAAIPGLLWVDIHIDDPRGLGLQGLLHRWN